MPVDPEYAAFSFGPFIYVNIAFVNLIFFLYVLPVKFKPMDNPLTSDKEYTTYLYWYAWIAALIAIDVPFLLPAILYPFIFSNVRAIHSLYYNSVLFSTIGPFLGFFVPILLVLASYFEGLTSGIWVNPNN